uniref:Uncharacterized protein n=1 Tax=Siphoviridae sp. ctqSm5 TaxID=2827949 RepID=A0A8S5SNW1_9CAUD|nr:MAG TPA: hypothetical protein [Siphoviridae sp. ctqSm5]
MVSQYFNTSLGSRIGLSLQLFELPCASTSVPIASVLGYYSSPIVSTLYE